MTIVEYFNMWDKQFDFFAQMSDDYSVTIRAQGQAKDFFDLAEGCPIKRSIAEDFMKYNGTLGKSGHPKLEDYIDVSD